MIFAKVIFLCCWLVLVLSANADHPDIHDETVNYEKSVNIWKGYYAVPRSLLTADDLNAIGLEDYVELGVAVNVSTLGHSFTMHMLDENQHMFIPMNSSLMFLFNSTSTNNMIINNDDILSDLFIQTSLPFGLPRYHYIVDLFLMVPKVKVQGNELWPRRLPLVSSDVWLERMGFNVREIPLLSEMVQPHSQYLFLWETIIGIC